jgi:hypothetical protein
MPNDPVDFTSDLGAIRAKLDSALVGVRIAEKMAQDASAAIDRLRSAGRPIATPAPLKREPLAVSRAEAGRLLARSRQAIWRMIQDGRLEVNTDGQITMESVNRVNRAKP